MATKPQHYHWQKKLLFLLSCGQHFARILPLSQWLCRKSTTWFMSRRMRRHFFSLVNWTTFWQRYACPEGSRGKISLPVGVVVPFSRRCLRSLLSFGIRNPTQGIWNLANDCNPKSKFRWQGIRGPVPEIQNLRLFWQRNWPALCFCFITVNSLLSSPSLSRPASSNPPPFSGEER